MPQDAVECRLKRYVFNVCGAPGSFIKIDHTQTDDEAGGRDNVDRLSRRLESLHFANRRHLGMRRRDYPDGDASFLRAGKRRRAKG